MCGITAVIALESFSVSELNDANYAVQLAQSLQKSLDTIKHRGPDDRGHWISPDNRVALGHVRLSINDLSSAGRQPFCNDKQGVYAVVNGEFYDYESLREELANEYDFESTSDSEIVIALYLRYGTHFLSKLRGEFSVVLYDAKRQFLIATRDRYGIKPLFWTVDKNRLLIASEAKAFLPLGWSAQWDVRSVVEDGWLYDDRTLFKGVYKVPPGHYLTSLSFGYTQTRSYWDPDYPDRTQLETRTEEEMILGLRERLLNSVRLRMKADVPVGIYLSGGIDSAVVAGMAAKLHDERVQGHEQGGSIQRPVCFGIGFEENKQEENLYDETAIAQRTAEFCGLEFKTLRMTDQKLAENFADAVFHAENHHPDLNFVGKFMLSTVPGEHGFKVVLTGEGSDELLGGYPYYHPDAVREPDLTWPKVQIGSDDRKKFTAKAEDLVAAGVNVLDAKVRRGNTAVAQRMLNETSVASQPWPMTLPPLAPWTQQRFGEDLSKAWTRAISLDGRALDAINNRWHPLNVALYVWNKSMLANMILTCLGDRSEMAHSIEGRPPFLDHELASYINYLPPSLKVYLDPTTGEVTEKWILRQAARPYITEELYKRKKHPFSAPLRYPKDGPIHTMLKDLLTRENLDNLGFVDTDRILEELERGFTEPQDTTAIRLAFVAAQWVVLSHRFTIKRAEPPFGLTSNNSFPA